MSYIELLHLKQIWKVSITRGVFSQRIPHYNVVVVNLNYHKNPVETVYILIKIRTKWNGQG
jgi:hypothetical protein